jgi:hypothetical protein
MSNEQTTQKAARLARIQGRLTICPRPGCEERISPRLFACRADWFALSRPVRAAIWATVGMQGTQEREAAEQAAQEEWADLDAHSDGGS